VIQDTSGLTDNQVRDKAKRIDEEEAKEAAGRSTEEEQDAQPLQGKPEEKENLWEDLAPTPEGYDWIQLKSGEWLKGEFKSLYRNTLEFDSDELDLLTFDFEDVRQIRTYNVVTLRIETKAKDRKGLFGLRDATLDLKGILRLKDDEVRLIQGDSTYRFHRNQVVSIAIGEGKERRYWSGKVTLNLQFTGGNTSQVNYGTIAYLQRRTTQTRLRFDYLGNFLKVNGQETENNNRLNGKFDIFLTRSLYVSPFAEYYKDVFKNIDRQTTWGLAVCKTFVDTPRTLLDAWVGPAAVRTRFATVEEGEDRQNSSLSFNAETRIEHEISNGHDLVFDYRITVLDKASGTFKHHMITTFENELTSWLDLDISFLWDYTHNPTPTEEGIVPKKSDYQLMVGLGVEF